MLAQAHDLVEDALGDFPLGGLGDFDDLVVSNDRHFVALGIEADAFAGYVVHYDAIEMFRRSLPDGAPRRCLDRLSNRLTKILAQTRRLSPSA